MITSENTILEVSDVGKIRASQNYTWKQWAKAGLDEAGLAM